MSFALYVTGSLANHTTIVSRTGGIGFLRGVGTLSNYGAITANGAAGVFLAVGGRVINHAGAAIKSTGDGIGIAMAAAGAVDNSGLIAGGRFGIRMVGGTVVNHAGGTIGGGSGIVITSDRAIVTNAGYIRGTTSAGLQLGGGSVTNAVGGDIVGQTNGVAIAGGGRVCNAGTILGGRGGAGVALAAGGSVRNAGYIGAFFDGYGVSLGSAGLVTNAGRIDAHLSRSIGVAMPSGTVINTGTIAAAGSGILFATGGTVVNGAGGFIGGSLYAGVLGATSIVNAGTINGDVAVVMPLGGTLTNAGLLSGYGAVWFGRGTTSRLIVDPGARFRGGVAGGGSGSVLELAGGAAAGTMGGLGSQFTGFARVMVDPGAVWCAVGSNSLGTGTALLDAGVLRVSGSLIDRGPVTLAGSLLADATARVQLSGGLTMQAGSSLVPGGSGAIEIGSRGGAAGNLVTVDAGFSIVGAGTVRGAVTAAGKLVASGGTLAVVGTVGGTGAVAISPGAVFSVTGALSASGVSFLSGGHATAVLGMPAATSSLFHGFRPTDTIDLVGFVAAGLRFAGGVLTVSRAGGGTAAALHFAGSYSRASFAFTSDGHGGTNILHT